MRRRDRVERSVISQGGGRWMAESEQFEKSAKTSEDGEVSEHIAQVFECVLTQYD